MGVRVLSGGPNSMSYNTYTFVVPHALEEAVDKYCRLMTYRDNPLEVLSKLKYGTERSPSITAYVLYSRSEELIDQAVVDISRIITDYNNRPIEKKLTFWEKLIKWRVGG